MSFEVDENSLWREAERRWSAHLSAQQWVVMNLAGVGSGSEAPLIAVNGGMVRAPDLMATKAGVTVYWEVKFRTTSHSNPITGEREHWMERAKVNDYLRVHHGTQCEVNVVLFDSSSRGGLGQWFVGSIDELIEAGRRDIRWASDLSEIDAWVWPKSAMRPISGPEFDMSGNRVSALPDEGEGKPVPLGVMAPIERNLRRKSVKSVVQNENGSTADEVAKIENVISNNFELGLQVLALETLELRTVPKYSVLQIGDQNIDVDELLGLLHYGIRVFLITPTKKHQMDAIELEAFEDSRLLEWAIVPEAFEMSHTIVDGIDFSQLPPKSKKILELAANSVYADAIQANCITANQIAANAITSVEIAANAVFTYHLVANAITANQIAANAITSVSVAANAITADKIDSRGLTIRDANGNILVSAGFK